MKHLRLAEFIEEKRVDIVKEWETFARSVSPPGRPMTVRELRDHADQILTAIVADMGSSQTARDQAAKSKGHGEAGPLQQIGQIHAELRIDNGFKLAHMVAEYRALRASVLRLWEDQGSDPVGVTRFNEAIDEALTEAVTSFANTTDEFRDQALGVLGHDLRNPLNTIVMASSTMLEDELDDGHRRMLTRIANGANRMARIVADLIDLTKTRFGEVISISPTALDLELLCRKVVADENAVDADGTPVVTFAASGDLRGDWDADRIQQALINLIGNAITYRARGKVDVVARGDGPDEVILSVRNGGAPIAPSMLAKIAEPHVRRVAGPSDRRLGLSLYVTSQIMIAHGGKLSVTSTTDAGTVFRLHLPRVMRTAAAPKPATVSQ